MFPVSGFMITEQAAMYIMIAGILLGIIFLGRLITYDNYTLIYKRELSENMGPALVMYYLLQPFDGGTNLVSPAYKAVKLATYFVSFFIMEMELESLYFGIGTIAFCVLYCIAACVLVYIFAPRTFRIRGG